MPWRLIALSLQRWKNARATKLGGEGLEKSDSDDWGEINEEHHVFSTAKTSVDIKGWWWYFLIRKQAQVTVSYGFIGL